MVLKANIHFIIVLLILLKLIKNFQMYDFKKDGANNNYRIMKKLYKGK